MRLGADYFERIYAEDPDPWSFETSWYETRKYALSLAALPRRRYRSAYEPGCSNGVLTERLAWRCDRLAAMDLLPGVAERARQRVAHLDHVTVTTGGLPEDWPCGDYDLVVLSEVAYYLTAAGLDELLDHVATDLAPEGHLLAVHWRGETDYPLTGDEVHATIAARLELRRQGRHEEEDFLLEVFARS